MSVCSTDMQAYHGGLQHVRDPGARLSRVSSVVSRAAAAVDAIKQQAGLECQVVTGGGSGTYRVEAASGVYTEVQPGMWPWQFLGKIGVVLWQVYVYGVWLRQQT
jgi:D-serine deaminase-like pyridoxal phosphate-dependent protein